MREYPTHACSVSATTSERDQARRQSACSRSIIENAKCAAFVRPRGVERVGLRSLERPSFRRNADDCPPIKEKRSQSLVSDRDQRWAVINSATKLVLTANRGIFSSFRLIRCVDRFVPHRVGRIVWRFIIRFSCYLERAQHVPMFLREVKYRSWSIFMSCEIKSTARTQAHTRNGKATRVKGQLS